MFQFVLLVVSTLCIAAGGYIINDINDIEADKINKPKKTYVGNSISEELANNAYLAFTFIGVIIGFYISQAIGRSNFFVIFVIIAALLYIYSTFLKRVIIAGNLVISALTGISLVIVGVYELIPAITAQNKATQAIMFEVLFDYAIFAFLINFIREIVKDIQDVDGDYKVGIKTLPIILGKTRTAKIAFIITLLAIAVIVYYLASFLYMQKTIVLYFLVLIVGPLIYCAIKLFSADKKPHFQHISLVLKLTMVTGILSMLVHYFIR